MSHWSYLSPGAKGPLSGLSDLQLLEAAKGGYLKFNSLVFHRSKTKGRWRSAESIPQLATWFDPNTDWEKLAKELESQNQPESTLQRAQRITVYSVAGFLGVVLLVLAILGGIQVFSMLSPPPVKQFETELTRPTSAD